MIYAFKCEVCKGEIERSLPIHNSGEPQYCECGWLLKRVFTPLTFKIKEDGKTLVTNTLNREYKILPHQQVELMQGGLNEPPKTIF